MEDDRFKIYIHRLKDGKAENIAETFAPDFMHIAEKELKFVNPVHVEGTACVSGTEFVLVLHVKTTACLPCCMCNCETEVSIEVPRLMHTQDVNEIKSGVYRMGDLLREGILLELPLTAECCAGNCPERATLSKFFVKES